MTINDFVEKFMINHKGAVPLVSACMDFHFGVTIRSILSKEMMSKPQNLVIPFLRSLNLSLHAFLDGHELADFCSESCLLMRTLIKDSRKLITPYKIKIIRTNANDHRK